MELTNEDLMILEAQRKDEERQEEEETEEPKSFMIQEMARGFYLFHLFTIPFFHCMRANSLQSCLTLCDPMDCSPPGSSVRGVFQARILQWFAIPSSRGSAQPRDQTCISYVSCIGRWVLYH